jgi:hypothetical protein
VVAHRVAFPGSTWAAVARVNFVGVWYLQAGVYEINPEIAQYKYRFDFGSPFGACAEIPMTHSYRDDSPEEFSLGRRKILIGGGVLLGGLAAVTSVPSIATDGSEAAFPKPGTWA